MNIVKYEIYKERGSKYVFISEFQVFAKKKRNILAVQYKN